MKACKPVRRGRGVWMRPLRLLQNSNVPVRVDDPCSICTVKSQEVFMEFKEGDLRKIVFTCQFINTSYFGLDYQF